MRAIQVERWTRACCHPIRLTADAVPGDGNRLPIPPPPPPPCASYCSGRRAGRSSTGWFSRKER
eukprot:8824098-Lingulodinium_polyedra.AAC.1